MSCTVEDQAQNALAGPNDERLCERHGFPFHGMLCMFRLVWMREVLSGLIFRNVPGVNPIQTESDRLLSPSWLISTNTGAFSFVRSYDGLIQFNIFL